MHYAGGKATIGWQIANIINVHIKERDWNYVEPFCGGCSVIKDIIAKKRWALDVNPYLIEMWQWLQLGWIPPIEVSEEEYKYVKFNLDEDPKLTAFIGFGCSWGGKWFGGYSRDTTNRNYARNACNSLMSKMCSLMDVEFICRDYKNIHPIKKIVYCDPPYVNTTNGYGAYGEIKEWEFWDIMSDWSINNVVLVSSYDCPRNGWRDLGIIGGSASNSSCTTRGKMEKLFINSY